jgi:hypothetical protein
MAAPAGLWSRVYIGYDPNQAERVKRAHSREQPQADLGPQSGWCSHDHGVKSREGRDGGHQELNEHVQHAAHRRSAVTWRLRRSSHVQMRNVKAMCIASRNGAFRPNN